MMSIENRIPCLLVGRKSPYSSNIREVEYTAKCEELINNNRDIIDYRPVLSYRECIEEMARSRCLVVMSEAESFGFTPVEAAQVGTPTVWVACPGIDESMIEGVTGFRISRKEYRNWKKRRSRAAELFNRVIVLDQNEMISSVRSRYSIEACTRTYEGIYAGMVGASDVATA